MLTLRPRHRAPNTQPLIPNTRVFDVAFCYTFDPLVPKMSDLRGYF